MKPNGEIERGSTGRPMPTQPTLIPAKSVARHNWAAGHARAQVGWFWDHRHRVDQDGSDVDDDSPELGQALIGPSSPKLEASQPHAADVQPNSAWPDKPIRLSNHAGPLADINILCRPLLGMSSYFTLSVHTTPSEEGGVERRLRLC